MVIKNTKSKQQGFTIIELTIASAVFSLMLLMFLISFIQISRMFYKGINLSNTQEVTRQIVSSISDDIRFSHSDPQLHLADGYFCVGAHRYKFDLANQIGGTNTSPYSFYGNYGLVRQNVPSCEVPPSSVGGEAPQTLGTEQEMLSNGMQLNGLDISCPNDVCTIRVRVVFYGGDKRVFGAPGANNNVNDTVGYDAYTKPDAQCTGSVANSQFCATSDLSATVLQKN